MSIDNNKKSSTIVVLWSLVGILALLAWVAASSYGFWFIINSTSQGPTNEIISATIWPFAFLVVAVPSIAILLVGGLRTLAQVVELRDFLKELPSQVSEFDELLTRLDQDKESFAATASQIEEVGVNISEARGVVDEVASQLSDMEYRIKEVSRGISTSVDEQGEETNPVAKLGKHLAVAKKLFDRGATIYKSNTGKDVERARGWILEQSVVDLRTAGTLSTEEADYVIEALRTDQRTRRSGRANLTQNDIYILETKLARTDLTVEGLN